MLVFPGSSLVKNPPANVGDTGLVPDLGSSPREGNDNPLQYSCLEDPMDRGAWRATVHVCLYSVQPLDSTIAIFLSSWFPSSHFNVCLVFYSVKSSCLWLQILDSHSCQVAHQLKVNLFHVHSSESWYIFCSIAASSGQRVNTVNRCLVFLLPQDWRSGCWSEGTIEWMQRFSGCL